MKLTSVFAVAVGSVLLQVTLARYTVGGRLVFDFVLVGVVLAALEWGPVAGILAGTVAGVLQDLVAGSIVGVGGLTKTLVGFAAGVVGSQFILTRPVAKTAIVAAATVVHRLMLLGLTAIIEQRWPAIPWGAMLAETGINAVAGLVALQAVRVLPGAVARRREGRRGNFRGRRW